MKEKSRAECVRKAVTALSFSTMMFLVASPAISDDKLAIGKDIYEQVCRMCHDSGMAGAPRLGRHDEWSERKDKPLDELVQNTIGGLGNMPPQARFGEDETRAAVAYMLNEVDQ